MATGFFEMSHGLFRRVPNQQATNASSPSRANGQQVRILMRNGIGDLLNWIALQQMDLHWNAIDV